MKASLSILPLLVTFTYVNNASGTQWFPNRVPDTIWQLRVTPQPKPIALAFSSNEEDLGRLDLDFEEDKEPTTSPTGAAATDMSSDTTEAFYDLNNGDMLNETEGGTTVQMFDEDGNVIELTTSQLPPEEEETQEGGSSPTLYSQKLDAHLPDALKPLHYTVKLQPFINSNLSIHAFMEVEIEVLKPTAEVTLHITDIECVYHTVKLTPMDNVNGSEIVITHFGTDPNNQFFTAYLQTSLQAGRKYRYSMLYFAQLNQQNQGFYLTRYTNSDGNERRLAATIFQPTYARRAFPCFDEPALKATFDIFLVREVNMTSISNMPLLNTTDLDHMEGWVVDQFERTPPMSTYLVVFIISELAYINTTIHDDLPIRVWARSEVLHRAEFSLQATAEACTFLIDYFNVSYPLPKLDVIILPSNIPMAFEGWGAILNYAEESSLYSANTSLPAHQHQVGMILAHEVAHQWFGNLVTPLWWTDLWLNEGFASYMENVALAHVRPEWNVGEHQVMKDLHEVLRMDSLLSSHPISIPVYHPDEITKIFDRISYEKGSSIIRMMNHFLTEETFKKGITNYLNKHKFGGANQDNLWESLTMAGYEDQTLPKHLSIKAIMDTWTLQMGYPVINVVRNSLGTYATVSQERFLLERNNTADDHDYKWWVPLTYTTGVNPNFTLTRSSVWMRNSSSHTILTDLPGNHHWVIFNLQQTGFYRVNYDDNNWNLIIRQLQDNHEVIDVINRAQIIDDALNLALAGKLSYEKALSVTQYLKKEKELPVWEAALGNIEYMNSMLSNTVAYGGFQEYVLSLLLPLYEQLGFQSHPAEPYINQWKRPDVIKWACELGLQDCVRNARNLYKQWMDDPQQTHIIPSDLRHAYCTAIAYGGLKEWEFAWQQYQVIEGKKRKDNLISALSCNKDTWVKARYLKMAFTPGAGIRNYDTYHIFSSIASQKGDCNSAWNFLRQDWNRIPLMFGPNYDVIEAVIKTATENFNTELELKELEAFMKDHEDDEMIKRASLKAIRHVSDNIAWMERNYNDISRWLDERGFSTTLKVNEAG